MLSFVGEHWVGERGICSQLAIKWYKTSPDITMSIEAVQHLLEVSSLPPLLWIPVSNMVE